jgi:nitrate reductase NapD
MNVSGVLVVVPVPAMAGSIRALEALPGVDVHHTDPATGRMVVTIEGESIGAEVETLQRIKTLPDVVLAEMVHHHFEEDEEILAARNGLRSFS